MTVARVLAFVVPLGLDSFTVAAAVGAAATLTARDRLRISAVFLVFEAGMPLIGFAVGAPVARVVGGVADYLAAAALAGIGGWLLLGSGEERESGRAAGLLRARGLAVAGLGMSISMDELAAGFGIGLARLPVITLVAALAVQAFVAAHLGLLVGARIGARAREGVQRLAGVGLVGLGCYLIAQHLLR